MDNKEETLIRVEQQLQDSIKNQSQIIEDVKELFFKIDDESKSNASLQAELNTHIETSNVIKDNDCRRLEEIEEKQSFIEARQEDFIVLMNKIEQLKEEISKKIIVDINDLMKEIQEDKKEIKRLQLFSASVSTSVLILKWLAGITVLTITAVWPVIVFLITKKGL